MIAEQQHKSRVMVLYALTQLIWDTPIKDRANNSTKLHESCKQDLDNLNVTNDNISEYFKNNIAQYIVTESENYQTYGTFHLYDLLAPITLEKQITKHKKMEP